MSEVQVAKPGIVVTESGSTYLQILINRAASRRALKQQFSKILSEYGVRSIGEQIAEGLNLIAKNPTMSFPEASRRVAGDDRLARRLRYRYAAANDREPLCR